MNWVSRFFLFTFIYVTLHSAYTVIGTGSVPVSKHRVRRIINGEETNILHFPFQVQIIKDGEFICGGSVISSDWILTAAHCLEGGTSNDFKIFTKSTYVNKNEAHRTKSFKVHEKYNPKELVNDIAVLQVEKSFTFDDFTQPIQMIAQYVELEAGTPVTSSGWGYVVNDNGHVSKILKKSDLFVVSTEECSKKFRSKEILDSYLCAGYPNIRKGPCHGDSGGPLKTENNTLVGVVSFGANCYSYYYPVVFTKVSYYRDWVKNNTGV